MRLFLLIMFLPLLFATGCASTNATTKSATSYERRKELSDEKFEWMKSTGMNSPNGTTSILKGGQW